MTEIMSHSAIKGAITAVAACGVILGGLKTVQAVETGQRLDVKTATPIELGTRYGQAAGVALVCYGLKVKPDAAEALKSRFKGKDLKAFDKQAGKILAAWERTLRCEDSSGPNECKLSHTWSCQQGFKELGPTGTVIPGLVEQKVK